MTETANQIDFAPDLTLTRDPATIWPDAMACPDFPLQSRGAAHKDAWSRKDAEARLRTVSGVLNGGGPLRAPTEEERADAMERYFQPRNPAVRSIRDEKFDARGFTGLMPATGSGNGDLIAEAVHLRGYLRKLAAQEERAATDQQDRAESNARSTLDNYRDSIAAKKAEAEALAEGAARYRQWLDDRAAFERLRLMPHDLERLRSGVVSAALELGEAAPPAPDWIETLCKGA
ncbi:hypothetical protein [Pararhodobacter sp.]|uniref:hypothetical protein n=1 Tax=Pararhodobacter sp. TaxID=2127056 RepID=UPI002FDD62F6